MFDVTAGQATSDERLSAVFVAHQTHLHRFIHEQMERRDWHLAEDLTSEVFYRLVRHYRDCVIDREFGLLKAIARTVIADHYRVRRSTEVPTDFSDWFEARRLPAATSAEDIAVERLAAHAMLTQVRPPLAVAA